MQKLAASRGGECLSDKYVNNETHLFWECAQGHHWKAKPANVQTGTWCPYCRGQYQTIEDLSNLARPRGGQCLSTEYRGQARKHHWRCSDGHEWTATPNSLKNGSWCPRCHVNYGEEICRLYMEAVFQVPFPRVFPEFLREGRRQLQLDGYNEGLRLAFEHQGTQHYRRVRHFHRSDQDFQRQLARDREKRKRCARLGVRLICTPEVPGLTRIEDLPSVIREECERERVTVPPGIEATTVDISGVYHVSALEQLHQIANSHGGACLSQAYAGGRVKLQWRCARAHEWEATPNSVKTGTWCPLCYGNRPKPVEAVKQLVDAKDGELTGDRMVGKRRIVTVRCAADHAWDTSPRRLKRGGWCPRCRDAERLTIQDMRAAAAKRGGSCLSDEYVNNAERLRWRCQRGHEWKAPYASIQQGRWCPKCGRKAGADKNRDTIENMRAIAFARGGQCLSTVYVDSATALRWRCAQGHEWLASPSSIRPTGQRKGSWCPTCAYAARGRAQRGTIEEMRAIAARRAGKCLSTSYHTQGTRLEWECVNGHRWLALPSNIKKGRWCPTCSRRKRLTIEEMRAIAASCGGKCLSQSYTNVATKLLWECANGHTWWARPDMIKGTPRKPATWCPKCRCRQRG